LIGDNKTPHEILGWRRIVEQALIGLNLTTGTNQYNMAKQFMQGSALSSFKSVAMVLLTGHKADAIVHGETQLANHPAHKAAGHDHVVFANLQAAVTAVTNHNILEHLGEAYGAQLVTDLLNEVVKNLLPNKALQSVKQHLRREARKPMDMSAIQDIMHIYRINTKEILRCPPAFNTTLVLPRVGSEKWIVKELIPWQRLLLSQ